MYVNIEQMIGFRIPKFFHYCWKYITPVINQVSCNGCLSQQLSEIIFRYNGTYEYPMWGTVFGWILALTSIVQLPISMLYIWFTAPDIPKVS
ncbi:hypothetical protein BLA29_009086 [Euroglyphus maynei]|uniref:Uncharacterized protein n=1 Tax=Euroglyphus maynei TaxID=6958 RepID=A0A1Y3AXQ2_EURMA|nr:hypothetical protein BLA29_009086 [Euroglyphus maynei]